MKRAIFILFIGFFALSVSAQEFEVPENYKLKKESDYVKYEQDILKCIDWLMETPVDKEPRKRKKANKFLMEWISGSPDIEISLTQEIVTFMGDPELLMIFMGGWAKYSIENEYDKDAVKGNMAGIEAIIAFYTKNKESIGKNKDVEKFVKMKEKGKLEAFIKEHAV